MATPFLLFILIFSPSLFAQKDYNCKTRNDIGSMITFADKITRKIEQDLLAANPFDYCNAAMAKRFLLTAGHHMDDLNKLSHPELLMLAQGEGTRKQLGGWLAALIPTKDMKELAFRSSVYTPSIESSYNTPKTIDDVKMEIRSVFESDPCTLKDSKGNLGGSYALDKLNKIRPSASEGIAQSAMEITGSLGLCSELVPLYKLPKCSGVLGSFVSDMQMRGLAGEFTHPELFSKVISSPAYDKGLAIAALKLIDRYQSPEKSSADLYSDLQQSFVEAGNSRDVADSMTWDTLGLVATGGANLSLRLQKIVFKGHRWPSVTALSAIASILPALDHKFGAHGNLYSLPSGVQGQCDTSKSYHFWMAAYLARKARINGADAESAIAATYSAAKAYANVGNFTARSGGAILTHSAFSPASQIMRADLSYSMAGAAYGAKISQQAKPISLDRGISALIESSKVQTPLSAQQVGSGISYSNYSRWSTTFAPNGLYRDIMSNTKFEPNILKAAAIPMVNSQKCAD